MRTCIYSLNVKTKKRRMRFDRYQKEISNYINRELRQVTDTLNNSCHIFIHTYVDVY